MYYLNIVLSMMPIFLLLSSALAIFWLSLYIFRSNTAKCLQRDVFGSPRQVAMTAFKYTTNKATDKRKTWLEVRNRRRRSVMESICDGLSFHKKY